jgi:hypothetical protein
MSARQTLTATVPQELWAPARAVAEVLADGTVREIDRPPTGRTGTRMASGVLSGEGWTIWWQRRSYLEPPNGTIGHPEAADALVAAFRGPSSNGDGLARRRREK